MKGMHLLMTAGYLYQKDSIRKHSKEHYKATGTT